MKNGGRRFSQAEARLAEGKVYVAKLRAAIKTMENNLKRGEPWPV